MSDRAAVVIGVDNVPGLEALESAARSAVSVAAWFKAEGYDVDLITDAEGPAHAEDVRKALARVVVKPARYQLLVVYFSGHGYWHARSDRWLFSGAPANGADAINLDGAMTYARNCGVETVVFISDACRSIPGVEGQRVDGIDALPNVIFDMPSKVDYFKATSQAAAAYEVLMTGGTERESVLTKALRLAYQDPTNDMVALVQIDGHDVSVVPNRRLENYLQFKVDELLGKAAPGRQQTLEINVPSADGVWMARLDPYRGKRSLGLGGRPTSGIAVNPPTHIPGLSGAPKIDEEAVAELIPQHHEWEVDAWHRFDSECGFVVKGGIIARAAATESAPVQVEDHGDGGNSAGLLRVHVSDEALSLVVQLEDQRSFVVPAFRGYIGHVNVASEGVSNVSYVPTRGNTNFFHDYDNRKDEIDRLRALVAIAIDERRFRVESDNDARVLANSIRVFKGYDPSLGLYAAHAYALAGLDHRVLEILSIMRADLGTSFFDVVLLASRSVEPSTYSTVPFCPVLTQSWSSIRPRGFVLPAIVEAQRPYLCDSLWTTFGPKAQGVLVDALNSGDLI